MMKTLFRALTISLLYTLVHSHIIAPGRLKTDSKNVYCWKQKGINICFPKKDIKALCRRGTSFPEAQYRDCLLSSNICDAPGIFPVPRVPTRYYKCTLNEVNGSFKKETRICDEGKTFDVRTQKCLTPEEMSISKSVRTTNNDCLPTCKKAETIANEHDCKSFYVCSGRGSIPVKLFCAPRKYFNEKHGACTDFMTKTCLEKLRAAEITSRETAKKHYCAVRKVFEQEESLIESSDDDDDNYSSDNNYSSDSNDNSDSSDFNENPAESEESDNSDGEVNFPEITIARTLFQGGRNYDMKYNISLRSLIAYAMSFGSKIKNFFSSSSDEEEDSKEEMSEVFEELWEQREENEKVLDGMHEEDDESAEVGKLISINNHLLKSVAEELSEYMKIGDELLYQNKYLVDGTGEEDDKKLEKLKYWLVLGRDQIAFANHLRRLAALLDE